MFLLPRITAFTQDGRKEHPELARHKKNYRTVQVVFARILRQVQSPRPAGRAAAQWPGILGLSKPYPNHHLSFLGDGPHSHTPSTTPQLADQRTQKAVIRFGCP
jgi:hypothetical protein